MSTSAPGDRSNQVSNTQGKVVLPPGVSVGAGRETSEQDVQGMIVQGMVFPVTLDTGTTTSVFVPYSKITDLGYVQALFDSRIQALQAIGG